MPAPLIIAGTFLTSLVVSFALPRPVLPILALVGSTVTLQWSADEYFFLSAWKSLAHERPSSSPKGEGYQLLQLGRWYLSWSESWGTMFPIVALPVTVVSGLRLAWTHHINGSSREIVAAYTIGTILAFAHVPAGQKAFPLVGKLRRAGEEYKSSSKEKDEAMINHLGIWTGMHWKRTLLVDVPAVVAFATGLYLTLQGS